MSSLTIIKKNGMTQMPELAIKDFSCIKNAQLSIRSLNIIIGPQGSGKSVTTKLVYFFADIIQDAVRHAEDGINYTDYKKHLQKLFSVWFPPSAWGAKRFSLNYNDGLFTVRVMRRQVGGTPSDDVTIVFSKQFDDCYAFAERIFNETRTVAISKDSGTHSSFARDTLEVAWRARDQVWKYIENLLGGVISRQTFIPAGRAFFTSIGRLVAGIEHAGSLDPATLKFAKIFAGWRDQLESMRLHLHRSADYQNARGRIMNDLFGGTVQAKRDSEFIEMKDGRKVPFSSLSSGQQELLPIWYFLDNMMFLDEYINNRTKRSAASTRESELIYIEEPEAHLFPEAQSRLLDILVEVIIGKSKSRMLIITTHSPYIMSELNVLLKAGQISKRKKRNRDLGEIVDKSRWLQVSDVAVLSIENGCLKSIISEEEGLVDASFLDSVSDSISQRFSALLDLEDEI